MTNYQTMTVSDRLNVFLKAKNINASQLSKMLGDTSQKYYKILSNKSSPNYDTLKSVLDAFPELSAEWLMRGIGDIFTKPSAHTMSELETKLQEQESLIKGLKLLAREGLGKYSASRLLPVDNLLGVTYAPTLGRQPAY